MSRRTLVETLPTKVVNLITDSDMIYFNTKLMRAVMKNGSERHALEHFKACFDKKETK